MIIFTPCKCGSELYTTDTDQNIAYCYQCGQLVFTWGNENE